MGIAARASPLDVSVELAGGPGDGAACFVRELERRCNASSVAAVPLNCPGGLLPLPGLPLAAEIQCPVCGRRVSVRGPPPEGFKDPWAGSTDNRIPRTGRRGCPTAHREAEPDHELPGCPLRGHL
jgi:hypothetical protein